jgi:hypothetical protein
MPLRVALTIGREKIGLPGPRVSADTEAKPTPPVHVAAATRPRQLPPFGVPVVLARPRPPTRAYPSVLLFVRVVFGDQRAHPSGGAPGCHARVTPPPSWRSSRL